MTLRRRLAQQLESVQDLELASESRSWEGLELLLVGKTSGGTYLMGFAAEMLLKCAYFRFSGAAPADAVKPRLGPARKPGQLLIPAVPHEQYHSPRFWALLHLAARRSRHAPLAAITEAQLVQRMRRLHQNWWVEMRYRAIEPSPLEVRSVFDDVSWLRANYVLLWR
jgi:hypothetical protein